MRKNVQILICDRCGKSVMLKEKLLNPNAVQHIYESKPDGWISACDERNPYAKDALFKDLCPDCAKSYNNMIESFWTPKEIKAESDEDK